MRDLARMCGLNRAFRRWCDPARHGVQNVVHDTETIEAYARGMIERRRASEALAEIRDRITRQAAATALPDDALAQIIGGQHGRDVMG